MSIPEERLMAYADGELESAEHATERAQIEAAMKSDPAVARRVESHRALRAQLSGAFSAVLNEPVPDRLLAAVRTAPSASGAGDADTRGLRGEDGVTDLSRVRAARAEAAAERGRKRAAWSWPQWGAVAASMVFGAIIAEMGMKSPERGLVVVRSGHLVAQGGLDAALSTQLASEQEPSAPVHIGVSFKTKTGEYCRTFVSGAMSGLACREGSAWDVRTLARADVSAGGEGGYHPAGSEMPAAVRAAVEDQIDGDPFDATAEVQAKTNGWK